MTSLLPNPLHWCAVFAIHCNATMQQLLKLRLGRPTDGNPNYSFNGVGCGRRALRLRNCAVRLTCVAGRPKLVSSDHIPNVTDRRGGENRRCFPRSCKRATITTPWTRDEQLPSRWVESDTQCTQWHTVTHSAHRLESRLHTEPVLQNRRQHLRGFYPLLLTTTNTYRMTSLGVGFFQPFNSLTGFKFNAGIPYTRRMCFLSPRSVNDTLSTLNDYPHGSWRGPKPKKTPIFFVDAK